MNDFPTSVSRPWQPALRTALLGGLLTAGLCGLWFVFLYLNGHNPYGPKRLLSVFFPPLIVLVGQWWLRRYYPATGPGLARSVGTGVLIALLGALLASVSLYVFARQMGPGLINQHLVETRALLVATKAWYLRNPDGLKHYEATLRGLAFTPASLAQDEFLKKLLLGLVAAIPGGIFLRK